MRSMKSRVWGGKTVSKLGEGGLIGLEVKRGAKLHCVGRVYHCFFAWKESKIQTLHGLQY